MDRNEKAKRKISPARRKRWVMVVLIISSAPTIVILLAILGQFTQRDFVKSSLDAEFLPTAEHLLANPEPDIEAFRLKILGNDDVTSVCVYYVTPARIGEVEIYLNTLYANFPFSTSVGMPALQLVDNQAEVLRKRCTAQKLDPGIHLLEIRLKASPYELRFLVHQWAFEII